MEHYDVIIVGSGLSGVVMAEQLASKQNKKILIIDKRDHIGGNCFDYIDEETGILMNKYGAHLFHTNDEEVFNYINKYASWSPWEHKVLGLIDDKHLPIPVNITTVNEIYDLNIGSKEEMDIWLSENQVKYENITNGEEMAKSRVGEVLYEKIFKHYTYKQWKKYPDELAPEVLARIPVRNSFDDRYFSDKYQVLPEKGYTAFFQSILDKHKDNIDVKLNFDFFNIKDQIKKEQLVIYTGPIDAYFADKGLPKLEYRSIDFHIERKMNTDFYQPYSVVNYPSADTPYTRCIEYKHFLNQQSDHTVYVKETTTDTGEPYYPVLNDKNKELYVKYQKMAEEEGDNIHFLGRLASYKYFNMDQAIKNSLDYYKEHFEEQKLQNKITVIISRYNEDVDWINTIKKTKSIEKILVFNKGTNNISLSDNKIKVYNVKNIGREGGTYLDYIIDNYGKFPENLIFTQADPFEHNPKFLDFFKDENIELYINKDILSLTKQWKITENIPPQKYVKYNNSYNIDNLESIKYFINKKNLQCVGHSVFNDEGIYYMFKKFQKQYKSDNILNYICELTSIKDSKNIVSFIFSACFFVKSQQIMRHPKEVYIKLRKFLYNFDDQGGIEGYILERFWYYLFTCESYDTIDECLQELFVSINPIIKIYCDKRKMLWFKDIKNCKNVVENPDTYIIYGKNGEKKILPGLDYVGSDILVLSCNNLELAKKITLQNMQVQKNYTLVISRFNESLKWTNMYAGKRFICNKGETDIDIPLVNGDKIEKLENIGRESHTYLWYIIKHYDNLPEYIGFSQGRIDDHVRGRINIFETMLYECIISGKSKYRVSNKSKDIEYSTQFSFNSIKKYDPTIEKSNKTECFIDFLKNIDVYNQFIKDELDNNIKIYPNGLMVISREQILSRSKSYYEKIIKFIDYHINPEEGHYFERSWAYIFNCNIEDKIIKIYDNIKKKLYFKNVNGSGRIFKNKNTYIFLNEENIISEVDYEGPSIYEINCKDINKAFEIKYTEPIVKIYDDITKIIIFKDIRKCQIAKKENSYIISVTNGKKKLLQEQLI